MTGRHLQRGLYDVWVTRQLCRSREAHILFTGEAKLSVLGLSDETWDALMDGLVLGRYSLLLGAGAGRGTKNGDGEEVPATQGLIDELQLRYGLPPVPPGTGLRSVYDLAELSAVQNCIEHQSAFLGRKFSRCTVPHWYQNLVTIPWRIIWN
ncbi:hypothetical protein ABIB36_003277 [Rhodococcus sp. UYP9]